MEHDDLAAHARTLLAANAYLTLGTVDRHGHPWTSPVYFAADGLQDFYWTSTIDARHSRNIAAHPNVSIVVFDSTVPPYHGQALYALAVARQLPEEDTHRALEVYPGPTQRGGTTVTAAQVTGTSPWRLYAATASKVWVLCPRQPRQPCPLHHRTDDHRAHITPLTPTQPRR